MDNRSLEAYIGKLVESTRWQSRCKPMFLPGLDNDERWSEQQGILAVVNQCGQDHSLRFITTPRINLLVKMNNYISTLSTWPAALALGQPRSLHLDGWDWKREAFESDNVLTLGLDSGLRVPNRQGTVVVVAPPDASIANYSHS